MIFVKKSDILKDKNMEIKEEEESFGITLRDDQESNQDNEDQDDDRSSVLKDQIERLGRLNTSNKNLIV